MNKVSDEPDAVTETNRDGRETVEAEVGGEVSAVIGGNSRFGSFCVRHSPSAAQECDGWSWSAVCV
jgi:hypothetical protein